MEYSYWRASCPICEALPEAIQKGDITSREAAKRQEGYERVKGGCADEAGEVGAVEFSIYEGGNRSSNGGFGDVA
ncbi:unnamed protein product [Nezara viridula]|uniref:Uncharacterized protein n=1 Tax=Nezara viridula TaxID=85310 RepID=A0A9P0MSY1_NEZVI|nr:unnamed protein product [Nezara viridula]